MGKLGDHAAKLERSCCVDMACAENRRTKSWKRKLGSWCKELRVTRKEDRLYISAGNLLKILRVQSDRAVIWDDSSRSLSKKEVIK